MPWIHLTARVSLGTPELTREDTGHWLWAHMRTAFPSAIAAVLMPDHPHVVLASEDPESDRLRLARLIGQFGRYFGVRGRVSRVPPAEPIRGGMVLARQVRYVALNPCRKQLVACPLAWPWSTHRDVVGAVADPWVTATRLARALEASSRNFAKEHHAYVSADFHADVAGTPFPQQAKPTTLPDVRLLAVAEACAAALRVPLAALRRPGEPRAVFVALAVEQGWGHNAKLAEVCGCSVRTVRRRAAETNTPALAAARLCLGDARLRRGPIPSGRASLRSA